MKHLLPPVAPQVILGQTQLVAPSRIAEIKAAVSRAAPDLLRNRVDYQPQVILRFLPIFDIGIRTVPSDDPSCRVPQGDAMPQKPAILPVRPATAHLLLEGLSSGCRLAPGF